MGVETVKLPNRQSGTQAKSERFELFKAFRAHQRQVAAEGGGTLTNYLDSGRTEVTYASATYGEHAVSAFWSAIAQQNASNRFQGNRK